ARALPAAEAAAHDLRGGVGAHRGRRRAALRRGEAMTGAVKEVDDAVQSPPAEAVHADELAFLEAWDTGARPPGWRLTPRAVVTFVCGSREALRIGKQRETRTITEKFVGD